MGDDSEDLMGHINQQ